MRPFSPLTKWLLLVAAGIVAANASVKAAEPLSYNRDVRPILAANCFACHGPDESAREGDLRLDIRATAIANRDGSAAIVPGDPNASVTIERITAADKELRMPPPDSGKQLTVDQIEILRKWITAGANYERHWAFEPVGQPRPPFVRDNTWTRTAIDRFVLSVLERRDLSPSAEADRYTLIRRVYLDLLGILPNVEAVDAFIADPQPDAYERLVDRVLADPAFGERWGRHWLDQARYADSHGYTNDNERSMWPYRDWVIDAVNRDLPFDQFTVEQLAGDLLGQANGDGLNDISQAAPSNDQIIATGFHRNTLVNSEGGVKADQFHDEQTKDRVDTTGSVWLGLTVGCAQCHSHKYDPISQTEYYQLYAFYNSSVDNNSVPPVLSAPSPRQQERLDELTARLKSLQSQIAGDTDRDQRQSEWEAALVERKESAAAEHTSGELASKWTLLDLDGKSPIAAVFQSLDDKSIVAGGENNVVDEYEITAKSPLAIVRSVRLEVLTHESLPRRGPGRAENGNFVLSEFWFITGDGRELRFARADADHSQPGYDVAAAIDGNDDTGWAINGSPEGGPNHNRTAWFVLGTPLELDKDRSLTFRVQHRKGQPRYNIGRLRISISSDEWVDVPQSDELAKLAAIPTNSRGAAQRKRLDEAFLRSDDRLGPAFIALQSVTRERDQLQAQIPTTMVMRELAQPRPTHVQLRGDFLKPGEEVRRDVPSMLPPLREVAVSSTGTAATRLDLARWLVRDDHPLTPRVRVNRVWMHLFGMGLVETENDFGTQGTPPSHPELLDWLASEHIREGWSTKQLVRQIVGSQTYRQRSQAHAAGVGADPRNRLYWRQNRNRVEAEIVRDVALSASGLLTRAIGGPSVYPPQPDGVYAFTQRAKNWPTSTGANRYRRGMYTFLYRSAPHPMLSTFDAPAFNQACTRRDRSNTPLQSLTVANDESITEMTQALAREILAESSLKSTTDRLTWLFRRCLVRPPNTNEIEYLTQFFAEQRDHFTAHPAAARDVASAEMPNDVDAAERATWVATARVLLNLDEFITRE